MNPRRNPRGHRPRRSALAAALALAALTLTLMPGLAPAKPVSPSAPPLSPRLAELAQPAVRALPPARQAAKLDLAASGAGSLLREGSRLLVDVRFGSGAGAKLDALRGSGARVVSVSRRHQTVTVAVNPASLRRLAAVAGVELVSENRTPLVYGTASTAGVGAACEGGSIVSEGVAQLQAAVARSKYGVSGSGVTVGVLSDSFDQAAEAVDGGPVATHAADDVASGDLAGPANPCLDQGTPVDVLDDFPATPAEEPADEGRAMLQIVHDVAPGAALAFATAFRSETSFAENIENLAKPLPEGAGADVIVDDVSWFEEPFFQDGPIAAAVNKVTAAGVAYFSAAGNNNLLDSIGREIASWEAPEYRDSGTCPAAVETLPKFNGSHCMDFKPSGGPDTTFEIKVSAGATLTLDLQWAEAWYGVSSDLDAFLLDANGTIVADSFEDNAGDPKDGATQRPVELIQWKNAGSTPRLVSLAINRFAGGNPRLKVALLQNGGGVTETEYPVSAGGDIVGPTIFGHGGAASAVSLGAIGYQTTSQPERYSSRGPVTHYFAAVDGTTAAAALPAAETIAKPDLVATDCGATTFFARLGAGGEWRFCGTSAAAPHAAAVAALQLQAKPAATPAEVRAAQVASAGPIAGFEPSAIGAGLLDADAAVAGLLPPAAVTITSFPASRTADSAPSFGFAAGPPASSFTCSIDGIPAQPCESPYTPGPLPDGPHLFEVSAIEAPSTVLGSASFAFTVDTTPPAITLTKRPPAIGADPRASVGFFAGEPAAFGCSMDGAAPAPCASPYASAALPDGAHSFVLTATDQVGNASQVKVDFAVDTVAPRLSFSERPPAEGANPLPRFGFAASEPAALTCSIDAGPAQACASPFQPASPLGDGPHSFEVLATDPAGNSGRLSASFAVDTHRPQTFIVRHPRRLLLTRQPRVRVTFRFSSDEPAAGFSCKVDRGPAKACGRRLPLRLAAGGHRVQVQARDAVGNVDASPAAFRFRVERIG